MHGTFITQVSFLCCSEPGTHPANALENDRAGSEPQGADIKLSRVHTIPLVSQAQPADGPVPNLDATWLVSRPLGGLWMSRERLPQEIEAGSQGEQAGCAAQNRKMAPPK